MPRKRKLPARPKQQLSNRRGKPSSAKYKVFVSHSSRDTWLAKQIKKTIEAEISKVEVWLDEMSLTGGEEIITALRSGIK